MDNSSGVGVLDKAAAVLSALEAGPATLAQLVATTHLARPTAHRLAVALEHHRLVALHVPGHQAVVLECDGEPVRGRTREVGCCHQLRESCRAGLECAEDRGGLVQHADSARVVHVPILASRGLRRKYLGRFGRSRGGIMSGTLAEKVWDAHIV